MKEVTVDQIKTVRFKDSDDEGILFENELIALLTAVKLLGIRYYINNHYANTSIEISRDNFSDIIVVYIHRNNSMYKEITTVISHYGKRQNGKLDKYHKTVRTDIMNYEYHEIFKYVRENWLSNI